MNNQQNYSNWFGGTGGTNYYSSNYYGGGNNWGGGNWGGGYQNGGGWYGNNPYNGYHGGWYQGSWDGNYLGTGFGLGVAAGAVGSYAASGYGGYLPTGGYSYGAYDTFPGWASSTYSGWGLGGVASNALYADYSNPYTTAPTVVVQAPATAPTVVVQAPATDPTIVAQAPSAPVFDYSRPIDVTAPPPPASTTDSAMQVFDAARDSFKAGDYARALSLTDQALQQVPNDPSMHEFRALDLFALKRDEEAAAAVYAVLTDGPGWNWSTMISLYPDADTYTNQLRGLEARIASNPKDAARRFLLAYHYLVAGHTEPAREQFQQVASLVPTDQVAAGFVKALTPPAPAQPAPATAVAAAPTTSAPAEPPQPQAAAPTPPPADLTGTWKSEAGPGTTITLNLTNDGAFDWSVATKGRTESLSGKAEYRDNVLTLSQENGPPLAGKVEAVQPNRFAFRLLGNDKAPPLAFTR